MADERTQSTFTWLNSASRNRQHLHTMVSQAQIRQYYHSPQPVSQVSAHYINIQLNQVRGQTQSHHARGSHGQSTIRFSEINSQLRNDTRARHPSGSTTDTRIVAAVPEDGSVDDGVMNPWLDDKPEHCRDVSTKGLTENARVADANVHRIAERFYGRCTISCETTLDEDTSLASR